MYMQSSITKFPPTFKRLLILGGLLVACLIWYLWPASLQPSHLDKTYGLLDQKFATPRYAIATFLNGNLAVEQEDFYFTNVRMLTYQLLHANETKSRTLIPFIVLVTKTVDAEKQKQLARDGAQVVQVEDVPTSWWIKPALARWAEQFTKLRILQMVQYDRVLFIDADTILTRPVDGIFEDNAAAVTDTLFERRDQIKADEKPIPAQYVFAARSDNALTGERNHPFPPEHSAQFSAGFWLVAPSKELFEYLMSVMGHFRRFDPNTMEQSLLNYAFRTEGPMPWRELNYLWSATWPSEKDLNGGVATLHEKFWKGDSPVLEGTEVLQALWWKTKAAMEDFFSKHPT